MVNGAPQVGDTSAEAAPRVAPFGPGQNPMLTPPPGAPTSTGTATTTTSGASAPPPAGNGGPVTIQEAQTNPVGVVKFGVQGVNGIEERYIYFPPNVFQAMMNSPMREKWALDQTFFQSGFPEVPLGRNDEFRGDIELYLSGDPQTLTAAAQAISSLDYGFDPMVVGPPPGFAWSTDPLTGQRSLTDLQPLVGPKLENYHYDGEAGAWFVVHDPTDMARDIFEGVPLSVRPWLQKTLDTNGDSSVVADPVAKQWVDFILGQNARSSRRPKEMPFGLGETGVTPGSGVKTQPQTGAGGPTYVTPSAGARTGVAPSNAKFNPNAVKPPLGTGAPPLATQPKPQAPPAPVVQPPAPKGFGFVTLQQAAGGVPPNMDPAKFWQAVADANEADQGATPQAILTQNNPNTPGFGTIEGFNELAAAGARTDNQGDLGQQAQVAPWVQNDQGTWVQVPLFAHGGATTSPVSIMGDPKGPPPMPGANPEVVLNPTKAPLFVIPMSNLGGGTMADFLMANRPNILQQRPIR